MTTISVGPEVHDERLVQFFDEAVGKLEGAQGEMILDLSTVRRLDARALQAMDRLAAAAAAKSVKVVLSSVNVDVYKVLLLVKLAPRFSFPT